MNNGKGRMKTLDHIKLAVITGLVIGMIFGIVDSTARIAVHNFEWFEFYQSLLLHMIIFTAVFLIVATFVEFLVLVIKWNISDSALSRFYAVSIIPLSLLFYGEIFVNYYLLSDTPFWQVSEERGHLLESALVAVLAGLLYLFLLTRAKGLSDKLDSIWQRRKTKKLTKQFIFIAVVLVISSLSIDLMILNGLYSPTGATAIELEKYPNILLITLDTVRADHLSLYNYELNTSPNIDQLAKDSVVFENAISVSSWSLASHASILTGKYPSHHGASAIHKFLDEKETTLAETLRAKGFNTFGFTGSPFTKSKYGVTQGFTLYSDRLDFFERVFTYDKFSVTGMIRSFLPGIEPRIFNVDFERTAEEINNDVFKVLDNSENRPFFMFINYFDAHAPYTLGSEFRKNFTNETKNYDDIARYNSLWKRYEEVSGNVVDYMTMLYDTEIFHNDYHFGKLLDKLDDLGMKNNTIIIIMADHGEEFYEHGGFEHAATLYQEVIHVPLIIYYPEEFEAKRIEKAVSTTDIFPTILDILGLNGPANIDGISLLPLIKGEDGYNREYVYSELVSMRSLQYKDWKLIEADSPTEKLPTGLFDLQTDPKEQNNRIDLYDKYLEMQKLLAKHIDGYKTPTEIDNITTPPTVAGDWHHVVATYDAATSTAKVYLNGELGGKATFVDMQNNYANPLEIASSEVNRFDGNIDDLRIYSRALEEGEVLDLFNRGQESHLSSELLHWTFDDSISNLLGNNKHGSISVANFIAGKQGKGLQFDGADDYVIISNSTSLNSSSFSISMWFKPDQLRVQGLAHKIGEGWANGWRLFMNSDSGAVEFDARWNPDGRDT